MKQRDCEIVMTERLEHQTTLYYTVNGKQARPIFSYGVIPWTTPCLVCGKGRYKCKPFIPDTYIAMGWELAEHRFKWNKNTGVIGRWLRSFAKRDWVIFDPFTGGGTVPAVCKMLARRYLAFEIAPAMAQTARDRVRDTQPPLFVPEPEQATMFAEAEG